VAILLAALGALTFGASDYLGGKASRLAPAMVFTLLAEALLAVGVLVTVVVFDDPVPAARDLWIGAAAGLAGTVGVVSLYHALAHGAMTVVAPLTAVVAAVLPVTVGLISGERPGALALAGVAVALVSVALIGGAIGVPTVRTPPRLLGVAVLAGAGFGLLFVLFDAADDDAGAWPLLMSRVTSVPLLLVAVAATRAPVRSAFVRPVPWFAACVALFSLLGSLSYLEATRRGSLAIVAVVTSMYPASTVLLASVVDGERVSRAQASGLALAGVALVLITAG
jgi:drug/metabolite transporter (DMT)-like permease